MDQGKYARLNAMLKLLNKQAYKIDYIVDVTNGRSQSSKDLTDQEYSSLMNILKKEAEPIQVKYNEAGNRMRKKILSICHELGMHLQGTTKIDMQAVNKLCRDRGMFKKDLNKHSNAELPKLVTQFEAILNSYYKSPAK